MLTKVPLDEIRHSKEVSETHEKRIEHIGYHERKVKLLRGITILMPEDLDF